MKGALQRSRLLYGAAHSLLRRESGAAAAGVWPSRLAGRDLQLIDSRHAVPSGYSACAAHHLTTPGHQGYSNWAAHAAREEQPQTPPSDGHTQRHAHTAASASSSRPSYTSQQASEQQQRPIPVVPPPSKPAHSRDSREVSRSTGSSRSGRPGDNANNGSSHGGKSRSSKHSKPGSSKGRSKGNWRKHAEAAHQQHYRKPSAPLLFAECKTVQQLLDHLSGKLTATQARSALQQLVYIVKGQQLQAAGAAFSKDTQQPAAAASAAGSIRPPGAAADDVVVVEAPSSSSSSSSSSPLAAGRAVVGACSTCLQRAQPMAVADAALLAYAAVKVGHTDQQLLPALEAAVMAPRTSLSTLDASRLAVACSLGGPSWASPVLLTAVTTACAQHLRAMAPDVLVSTLRHLTLAGARFPELMEAAADRLLPEVGRMNHLTATKLLWLCAKQDLHHQVLLDAVSERIAPGLHQLSPSILKNVAWACSKLQYQDGGLCLGLAQRLQQQLRRGVSVEALPGAAGFAGPATAEGGREPDAAIQQNASTLLQISLQRPQAPGLMDAAADHVVAHSSSYTPAALHALVWSLAMSRHQRPDALEAVAAQSLTLLPQLQPDEVAKLVVALCAAKAPGPAAGAFFAAAMARLQLQAGQVSQVQLVDAVRALSVWPISARMQGVAERGPSNSSPDSSSSSHGGSSRLPGGSEPEVAAITIDESAAGATATAPWGHGPGQETLLSSSSSTEKDSSSSPQALQDARFAVLCSLVEEAISSRRQLSQQQVIEVYHALRRTHLRKLQEQVASLLLQLGGTQGDLLGSKQEADSWKQRFAGN